MILKQYLNQSDHPRGCGEHVWCLLWLLRALGSSPRIRGARSGDRGQSSSSGIIPADAGSTMVDASSAANFEDHPRGCGEHPAQVLVQ